MPNQLSIERKSTREFSTLLNQFKNAVESRGVEDMVILKERIDKLKRDEQKKRSRPVSVSEMIRRNMEGELNGPLIIDMMDPIAPDNINFTGGKADSSMRQVQKGLNVPPFFTVTSAAFKELTAGMEVIVKKYFVSDYGYNYVGYDNRPEKLGPVLDEIRDWIIQQEFSKETTAKLRHRWAILTTGKPESEWTDEDRETAENFSLAVRSTALAEDGIEASFAGQGLSLVNVRGFDNYIRAIKEVMASEFGLEIVQYKSQRGMDIMDAAMPVMVQKAVPLNSGHAVYGFSRETGSDGTWMKYNVVLGYGAGIADGISRANEIKINLDVENHKDKYDISDPERAEKTDSYEILTYATHKETGEKILYRSEYYPDQLKVFMADDDSSKMQTSKEIMRQVVCGKNQGLEPSLMKMIEEELLLLENTFEGLPQDVELGFVPYKIVNGEMVFKNNKFTKSEESGDLILVNDDEFNNIESEIFYSKHNIQSRPITTNKSENGMYHVKMPKVENQVIAKGRPGSEGVVSGKVRLVASPDEARRLAKLSEDNEIGITPFAEVEYGNVFITTDGFLIAVGSYTSHAMIVARESLKPAIYDISNLMEIFEVEAHDLDAAKTQAEDKLKAKGLDQKVLKNINVRDLGNNKYQVIFSQFNEGDTLTINGYTGEIYIGEVPALTNWQTEKEIFENKALLEEMEKKPTKFKLGSNASTSIAAAAIAQKGIKYNTLTRGEVWIGHAELDLSDALRERVIAKLLENNWISEQSAANNIIKGLDPEAVIYLAKEVEGCTFENIDQSEIYQAWVKAGSEENYEISKYFIESTYRFSGNAPEGRKFVGSSLVTDKGSVHGKTAFYQGVDANLAFELASKMEFDMIKATKKKLRDEGCTTKMKIMPQFVRTYEQLDKWLKLADKYGVNKENGFSIGTMLEVPSNFDDPRAWQSELYKIISDPRIEFVSIGTNDFSSLSKAIDRSESVAAETYPSNDHVVTNALRLVGETAREFGKEASICGEIISQYPDMAECVVEWGFTSAAIPNNVTKIRKVIGPIREVESRPYYKGKPYPRKRIRVGTRS